MWATAKAAICPMKIPQSPKRSPTADNARAHVICQGHIHKEAIASIVIGKANLYGNPTGRKWRTTAAMNNADDA